MRGVRRSRSAVLTAALVVMAIVAAGCGVTSTSVRCENATCEAKLSGGGATADIDALALKVTLKDTDGAEATLKIERQAAVPDKTVTLTERESAVVLGARVTLLDVDGSAVIVRLIPAGPR
jgi:hypothetical protein